MKKFSAQNWLQVDSFNQKQKHYNIRLFLNLSQHTSDNAYIGKTIQVFQKIITYTYKDIHVYIFFACHKAIIKLREFTQWKQLFINVKLLYSKQMQGWRKSTKPKFCNAQQGFFGSLCLLFLLHFETIKEVLFSKGTRYFYWMERKYNHHLMSSHKIVLIM